MEKGLAIAVEMFKPNLSPIIALKAITYFEGGDLHCLTNESKRILTKAVADITALPEVKRLSDSLGEDVVLEKGSQIINATIARNGYE